jgi:hypothetical protein
MTRLLQPQGDDPRWGVNVTDKPEEHLHTDDALEALQLWNANRLPHPPLLLRGDTLVRVSHDERDVKLASYTEPALVELLSEGVTFWDTSRRSNPRVVVPRYIAKAIMHRTPDKLGEIPRVNRVVEVPVFGANSTYGAPNLLGETGYDADSRTYYQPPPGFEMPALATDTWADTDFHSSAGTSDLQQFDVQAATALILELLSDFPFSDEASRAHAIAMMLEPFVREVIGNQPTPMYGVIAHTPGTGKGLLTQVCLGVACGTLSPMTFTGGKGFEAAESRKRLTAKLIEAPGVIFYDNVNEPLDDANLAAALTATRWSDRILGQSRMADVPIRNVWVFTANNPNISRELTRRIVPIFLDPGEVDPLSRTDWKHPLPEWANANRAELVAACLTLAANYFYGTHEEVNWEGEVYRSRPAASDVLASYSNWSKTLGGILAAAGIEGFLGNLDKLHATAAVVVSEEAEFLADWFERQAQPYTLRELVSIVGNVVGPDGHVWQPAELPLELRGHGEKLEVKLGAWLRDHRDSVIGGYRVRKVEGRPSKWTVEKIGA